MKQSANGNKPAAQGMKAASILAGMMMTAAIAIATTITIAAPAFARPGGGAGSAPIICKTPRPPVNKAFKPFRPTCITFDAERSLYNCTCPQAECNRFKTDLDEYNADIGEYVKALELYVAGAQEYAQCKVDEINRARRTG